MIATIRKLDCCGKDLWRTTTAHGVELSIDFDTQEDAREAVLGACHRANAWPLTIDTFLIPGVRTNSEILAGLPATPPAPAKPMTPYHNIITLAADSYAELRRCDVYRVLDAANNVDSLLEFGATLIAQRPDLRGEVEACIEELATPAFTLRNDPPKHTPARFQSQDKTRQRVLVEGMDCLPGQQDLF